MVRTLLAMTLFLAATASLASAQTVTRVRGVIEGVKNETLSVKARDAGSVAVTLAENYMVLAVTPAGLSDIKPGVYLSTAAVPQGDGLLKSLGVLVYPDVGRGINEGQYPYDLGPGSTITFATVAAMVDGADGPILTLKYKGGGDLKVAVPKGTPIATFDLGDLSLLKAGAAVLIPGQRQADGTIAASRIFVGKDGLVPPM